MSIETKLKRLNEIERLVEVHDSFYEFSDDMRAYSKGRDEYLSILKMIQDVLNKTHSEAHDLYTQLINRKA